MNNISTRTYYYLFPYIKLRTSTKKRNSLTTYEQAFQSMHSHIISYQLNPYELHD